MLEIWRRIVIGSAVLIYLLGLGCAGALLLQRMGVAGGSELSARPRVEAGGQWLLVHDADAPPVLAAAAELGR